jgi:predicted Zn-dependent protease with MMP-like domain
VPSSPSPFSSRGRVSGGRSAAPGGRAAESGARAARRRDRHGRGLRGPLVPAQLPGHQTRGEQFDELVLDAVERLEGRWARELEGVEFAVEDVPPSDPAPWEHDEVPLGRFFPASGGLPTRIVVYRRPVETRAHERSALAVLVHHVVVEQVAHLLDVEPSAVDPRYDED